MNVYVYARAVHDIAVTDIKLYKTVLAQNSSLFINVTLENQGDTPEIFNVTVYYDTIPIETQAMSLDNRESRTLTIELNTTGIPFGEYTIKAVASLVPDEIDTEDNTLIEGWVVITILGDLDGNFEVNILDIALVALAFGSKPADPNWNETADLDKNGIINIIDVAMVAKEYGKTV